jgi:hypothetical protein
MLFYIQAFDFFDVFFFPFAFATFFRRYVSINIFRHSFYSYAPRLLVICLRFLEISVLRSFCEISSSELSSGMSSSLIMEAARTSETSVDNYFTRQYIPEDSSELYTYFWFR